jgi:ABC-2 type transport system ATP-binding protein
LVEDSAVFGIDLTAGRLSVSSSDFGSFTRILPKIARDASISLYEMLPTDDSLESVFAYLVRR